MTDLYSTAKILAIDTSCDDTAVSVVSGPQILSNVVASQIELHRPYGGVFPTVAKLAHRENFDHCLQLALQRVQISWNDLAAIAVTQGPGLAPALEVGLEKAKLLAVQHQLPLLPINHVEAHAWSAQLQPHSSQPFTSPDFTRPKLSLVVSGGHTEFILISGPGQYQILGQTLDDAAGECLDKIGRLLNLGYPAGPVLEQLAKTIPPDSQLYPFPLPLTTRHDFDLSFSGLKTHARHLIDRLTQESPHQVLDQATICLLAASAQTGVFRHVIYKLNKLLAHLYLHQPQAFPDEIWLGGGVAANITLRQQLRHFLQQLAYSPTLKLLTPFKKPLCGDNAAMIGLIGSLKFAHLRQQPQLAIDPAQLDRQPNLKVASWWE